AIAVAAGDPTGPAQRPPVACRRPPGPLGGRLRPAADHCHSPLREEIMTTTRTRTANRDQLTETAADAAIEQACRILRLPTIRDRFGDQAAAAARQQATYKSFLSELLFIECEDREVRRKARLVKQAGFPRTRRIEVFDF